MSTTQDKAEDSQRVIAQLRQERDAALAQKAALAEELAIRTAELLERKTEFDERIEYQTATIDVLRAMSASPGDPHPVFDLIVMRARDLCDAYGATVYEFDGALIHWGAATGVSDDPTVRAAIKSMYPMVPTREWAAGRAILDRQIIRIDDMGSDLGINSIMRGATAKSALVIPLMRGDTVLGALALGSRERGGFSDSQAELLKTFAEQAVIAISTAETYRELQARTAALAARNSEYGERIEQQSATIDVLKVMSASPGDPQPVFDLIAKRARAFCSADHISIELIDNGVLKPAAYTSISGAWMQEYGASFPKPLNTASIMGRAILAGATAQIVDVLNDPEYGRKELAGAARSTVAVPLLRAGSPIGAIGIGRSVPGEFTAAQMELLWTFAEQAVIAISSAETYRALQERTNNLQESLEYQTATSDLLKVISHSTFDLQPVLDTLVETAARLCDADQAVIDLRDGELWRLVANFGYPSEYETYYRARGAFPYDLDSPSVGARTVHERRIVHIHDAAAVPGYPAASVGAGKQRTSLGVPLLREGDVIGNIILARQRVEPFTDRQIALVSTFADQAVIAIENTRLITEQREALEQQTATAEVLQVINNSPGYLVPVFEAMLEKASNSVRCRVRRPLDA